jgi:hypothetical protein
MGHGPIIASAIEEALRDRAAVEKALGSLRERKLKE